jgi:hypothetical protein
VLHRAAVDSRAQITKTLDLPITQPRLSIDKTGSIANGLAPQNVVYTFVVTNTSQTGVPMRDVKVTDDQCGNATYVSGDNGDGVLTNGEQWTYTCSMLHQAPGTFTNTAKACAISNVDDREVCSPPDTWTVVLTSPPPAAPVPQVAVAPAQARQDPCRLTTPNRLRVRAGELTTIRVRVRNVDAGSTVRLRLPGGRVLRERTSANGNVVFRVRPPRSGQARLTVADCSEVLRVRPARRVAAQRVPRVTG